MMIFLSNFFSSNRGIGLLFVLAARCVCSCCSLFVCLSFCNATGCVTVANGFRFAAAAALPEGVTEFILAIVDNTCYCR